MSVDGYIDDNSGTRLMLSNDADLDQVDAVRAGCDAILVGATTIRRDNPRLLVRSPARRQHRAARGLPRSPVKVTLTSSADLDPGARFFTASTDDGDEDERGAAPPCRAPSLVYVSSAAVGRARQRLGQAAEIIPAGDPVDLGRMLTDLASRRIARLMVEGGGSMHAQFLAAGLADELRLAIAPLFVADPAAPRFAAGCPGQGRPPGPARLAEAGRIGDVAVLRYALSDRFGG